MTDNIYARALKTWGRDAQLGMVQEECAELIKVINKHWRGKASDAEVIEECVDVELMINQMRELFRSNSDLWEKIKLDKLNKLFEMLSKDVAKA